MSALQHAVAVALALLAVYLCIDTGGPAEYQPTVAMGKRSSQNAQFNGSLPAVFIMSTAPYSELPHASLRQVFTPEECEGIIEHMMTKQEEFSHNEFRSSSQKYLAEDLQWVYERMEKKVKQLNRDLFHVDRLDVKVTGPKQGENIQFAQYHEDKRGNRSLTYVLTTVLTGVSVNVIAHLYIDIATRIFCL